MYVIGFEVTTTASGDVERQALVFLLGLRKTVPLGCGLLVMGLETVPVWTVCVVWFW